MTPRADPRQFSREHLEAQRGVASPELCELVVHSLEVIAQLAHAGLEFRFKGGNSQLILLPEPQRFSIDADIVTTVEKADLIQLVEGIAASCDRFSGCEVRQHKTKPWLPMVSFKLFFESVFPSDERPFVMLDAVLEPPPYPGQKVPIRCAELYAADEEVEVPTVSGLLADKLLCIGPGTLGIPLGKGKDAHRLKHVFDVATLSTLPTVELGQVLEALVPCMAQENAIQKSEWTLEQVIEDTRAFVRGPLEHDMRPPPESQEGYMVEIARGFPDFVPVLFKDHYGWDRFQEDCRRILTLLDQIEAAA